MGYTTEFEGKIQISPPASPKLVSQVNAFCNERHGGNISAYSDCPSIWCDFRVDADGQSIGWNGSEKAYEMDKWLPLLITRFFKPNGHKLNGVMLAQGEDMYDRWSLVVKDNLVGVENGHVPSPEEVPTVEEIAEFLYSRQDPDYRRISKKSFASFATTLLERYNLVRK